MYIISLTTLLSLCVIADCITKIEFNRMQMTEQIVQKWASKFSSELNNLSITMTRKNIISKSFLSLRDKIYMEDGDILINDIADNIKNFMKMKELAVQRIADYAELLSFHRRSNDLSNISNYDYYNADKIYDTDPSRDQSDLESDRCRIHCEWYEDQKNYKELPNNMFTSNEIKRLFMTENRQQCCCQSTNFTQYPDFHRWMPLVDDPVYDEKVNFNMSNVKVVANVYDKDEGVLNGTKWSDPLDLVFKYNLKHDRTLKYQYFASPVGYMRHYPAVKWSTEQYKATYDPRIRSWYTEAMTPPKDIIILLDKSGSMAGNKRQLSEHIVNNILDTLNDNDFVNIYTFSNATQPLIKCFNDTLVQANEENLRLLREGLESYQINSTANVSIGFHKAFELLEKFRANNASSLCSQAIMVITEGLDYDYLSYFVNDTKLFDYYNKNKGNPVRIFTYQLLKHKGDAYELENIACNNMGYYVNISLKTEIREKVLNYLNVMSRPVNAAITLKQKPIWSYLYADLADRRLSNWLWKKIESVRQRQVFLDFEKREYRRRNEILTSSNHALLQDGHPYLDYEDENIKQYDYMTTVSLPVYGRREDEVDLIGVAGVDVPIKLLKAQIPHHRLGVNAYAFILTNNGYIIMHPGHRREFQNILKPTFNRVDILEEEIQDDQSPPRLFEESIVQLREKMVNQKTTGTLTLRIKFPLDNMKRVILSKRQYFYKRIEPFSIGIALPDKYGLMLINNTHYNYSYMKALINTFHWKVHPEWEYCNTSKQYYRTPEHKVMDCPRSASNPLLASLLYDAYITSGYENNNHYSRNHQKNFMVHKVFLATHSGLTRWKTFTNSTDYTEDEENYFENKYPKTIDEDYYKRAVEENYLNDTMFIYSLPYKISGYENNTLMTSTSTIFIQDSKRRTPVAVVGVQFNHKVMGKLYKKIIKNDCGNITCLILDNNAYVVFSDLETYTGRFIGDIYPQVMYHLVNNSVYKATRMFDYQAICQKPIGERQKASKCATAPLKSKTSSSSSGSNKQTIFFQYLQNVRHIIKWLLTTIVALVNLVGGQEQYERVRQKTMRYNNLILEKTVPTPCDHEMWLYTLENNFNNTPHLSQYDCWIYVVSRIEKTNLILLAINDYCNVNEPYDRSPAPEEIRYPDNLPCYIAQNNKYKRRKYMNCYQRNKSEDELYKKNRTYCGANE